MSSSHAVRVLGVVALLCTTAGCLSSGETPQAGAPQAELSSAERWTPEQREVVAAIEGYLRAWNDQDADQLLAFCDGVYDRIDARGNVYATREAVHESYRRSFARATSDLRLSYEVLAVRLLTPEVAIVDASYDLEDAPAAPGLRVRGMNTVVLVKRDGRWLRAAHRQRIPITPAEYALIQSSRSSP